MLTPINWRLSAPEIAYIVNDSEACVMVFGRELTELVQALRPRLRGVEVFIAVEGGTADALDFIPGAMAAPIAVRSPSNMSGYWNLAEATAKTLAADGWLRTGDAGYLDDDGYLYIHDRIKDMITSGGENIYPAEVENAVFGHPAVADVAVIGVPNDKWGEAVKAMVVKTAGAQVSPEEIIGWARERIATYKAPRSIDFIDVLPRNASGKIMRRNLREPYWRDVDRQMG